MRIEHLLEQSRPRARETHYKDRRVLHCRPGLLPGRNIIRVASIHSVRQKLRLLCGRLTHRHLQECHLRAVSFFGRGVRLLVAAQRITNLGKREKHMMPVHEFLMVLQR